MEIQDWEHTTDSRDRDLRRQLADQARQIYDLESRLNHVSLQRDYLRQSNDRLFQVVRLAGSAIDGLHKRIWDQERELAAAAAANTISEESLRRLQEELRLTQEEVVTNAYVGSIQSGSTRGSTCGGPPPADQDSAPPDQASRDLTQARSEVTRLSHDLRVARESIARLTTERDPAQHDRSNVTAERDRLPADVGQCTETVDLTIGEIDHDGGASGEIEDDGDVSGCGNRGSTGKTSARPTGKQSILRGFGLSGSDEDNEGDEGDDDLEEAEIADELLEKDTKRAISQSRSQAVVDPTPLPLVILSVDREGRLAGQAIRMTTILGQVRQDLEPDRPGLREPAAQQAVLVVILPDLQDPCPVAQGPRHRASIILGLLGPEPDPPRPVARVALKAVVRPDRLPLFPSRYPLRIYTQRTLSGPIVTSYQVSSNLVS
ncbi:hypothetical protein PI124_g21537 [Phytophthora idaei]|nr:hypothetical protein PI125_g18518 [Phytophthora idaei]KAG3128697.1 hypothetical protein PI126_g21290 [Phytophthora idaei]KAG3233388.1 hypothetical protein PI124_g21537 [Phytophthora idaei]